jgi:hypothetical protein
VSGDGEFLFPTGFLSERRCQSQSNAEYKRCPALRDTQAHDGSPCRGAAESGIED